METETPDRPVPFYVVKALAVLAIAVGGVFTVIGVRFIGQDILEGDWRGVPISILFGALIYGPGVIALIFGVRALGRVSARSAKCLIASLLALTTFYGTMRLLRYCQPVGRLSEDTVGSLVPIVTVAAAILLYILLSRPLLRWLGLESPPIRESLPRWPLMILAFLVVAGLNGVVQDLGGHPDGRGHASASELAASFAPIPAGLLVYWVGKLLFSRRPD
ncbi:MAG: hypothetical protein R6V05_03220 [Candidatus Brocadiia bacterium]